MEDNLINRSYNGLLIVKAKNGNFNAGFDGNPRTLPNGTIFATDKALKYCLREYLALFKDESVFVRRNRQIKKDEKKDQYHYSYQTLEENFSTKLKELQNKGLFGDLKEKILEERADKVLEILRSFVDVRLFGIVFSAIKGQNISLTGPVQISYGVNKLDESSIYPVQILSPYKNPNDKSKESKQTTIGEETKADEVYYVYNISVNSTNAKQTHMTEDDLRILKEALIMSVDPITSCTKYGCESIALVWLNNKNNIVLNNLDDFVKIEKDDGEVILKTESLVDNLTQYGFNGLIKTEFSIDLDLKEKTSNENKIEIIYKKGKIRV